MKIHIISCSASESSKSRLCARYVQTHMEKNNVEVSFTDIRDLTPVWVNNRDLSQYPPEYQKLSDTITASDGVIFAWPVYNYTISSGAKAISEIISESLTEKPTAFITAGGSGKSYLATGDFMKSMIFEQRTLCFPYTVFVTGNDIVEGNLTPEMSVRVDKFIAGFLKFAGK